MQSKDEFQIQAEEIINRGQRLSDVVRQGGWKDVIAIIDSVSEEAINDLLKAEPGNTEKILGLHAQARAARVIRDLTIDRVHSSIEAAKAKKNEVEQKTELEQDIAPFSFDDEL
jgi:hypothetical protein